jgi:hypothetical protein
LSTLCKTAERTDYKQCCCSNKNVFCFHSLSL